MSYQSQFNILTAFKAQSALGSQASGAGGTVLRMAGGAGAVLTKAATESGEVRRDGMRTRGRHGTQKTTGEWASELSIGGAHEKIAEAVMRDTWDAADLVITEATGGLTSITTTTNTIVNGGGSWITAGLRAYDVIRLTNHASAGNNGRNIRLTGVTASTLTTAETLTANATPDTSFTITRPKKLMQYSAGVLVPRYYTVDEYNIDIDQSAVLTDFVFGSIKYSMGTNGIIMADPGGVGTGRLDVLNNAASPLLTSPTESTSSPLAVVDATIRVGGNDLIEVTSFDLTLDIGLSAPDVFGSGAQKYSPDVFGGQMGVSLNLTVLRKNLTFLSDFTAETQYSLHVLAIENMAEPKNFFSIVVPNFTLGGNTPTAPNRAGGPRSETVAVPVALVGKDTAGGAFDPTMVKFQSTGA